MTTDEDQELQEAVALIDPDGELLRTIYDGIDYGGPECSLEEEDVAGLYQSILGIMERRLHKIRHDAAKAGAREVMSKFDIELDDDYVSSFATRALEEKP